MENSRESLDFSLILASSVHDMKNSVGMLLNSLEEYIHESDETDPAQEKRIATLQYEGSRISGELIQLLSIYRMQDQRLPVQIDENFVMDTFDDQIARNDMLFQTRGIQVDVECDDNLRWYYDNELVGGVIHNILINCARYTREKIVLAAVVENNQLCIEIADDGGGYPSAMIDAPINEDRGVSFESGSTNLGLYFASKVAALHVQNDQCGSISLANGGTLGGGRFIMRLP
ncbi:HAMP domain-containing sensor histidine kinase [Aurantivibrio plasticivorans]